MSQITLVIRVKAHVHPSPPTTQLAGFPKSFPSASRPDAWRFRLLCSSQISLQPTGFFSNMHPPSAAPQPCTTVNFRRKTKDMALKFSFMSSYFNTCHKFFGIWRKSCAYDVRSKERSVEGRGGELDKAGAGRDWRWGAQSCTKSRSSFCGRWERGQQVETHRVRLGFSKKW